MTAVEPTTRDWYEWDRETVRTEMTANATPASLIILAKLDEKEVARLEAKIDGGTLLIQKISIAPEVIVKKKGGLFRKSSTVPGRGRGYGTMLIRAVQNFARREELHSIVGGVSAQDLVENRYVMEWYSRRGFIIERTPAPGIPGTAAMFRMVV